MTLLPMAHTHIPTVAAGGGTTVFNETWGSATPGTYTSGGITGADESGWLVEDGGGTSGVIVPNPASDYVTMSGNGGDFYCKNTDIKCTSTYNEIKMKVTIPSTNGGEFNLYLYNSNANERVFTITFVAVDEVYINGDYYDLGATGGTEFDVNITIDYSAKTFDITMNSGNVDVSDEAWGDPSGTDGDMKRFETYTSSNSNNLKRLGEIEVGEGII